MRLPTTLLRILPSSRQLSSKATSPSPTFSYDACWGDNPRYPQSTYTQGQVHKQSQKYHQGPGRLDQNCRLERSRPTPSRLRKASRTVRLKTSRIHQPTGPYKRARPHSTGVSEQYSLWGVITTCHDDPARAGLHHSWLNL